MENVLLLYQARIELKTQSIIMRYIKKLTAGTVTTAFLTGVFKYLKKKR